jgi:hypothetical protein
MCDLMFAPLFIKAYSLIHLLLHRNGRARPRRKGGGGVVVIDGAGAEGAIGQGDALVLVLFRHLAVLQVEGAGRVEGTKGYEDIKKNLNNFNF